MPCAEPRVLAHPGPARHAGTSLGHSRVLLLSEDGDLLDLLVFAVQQAGLRPLPARDRHDARGLVALQRPDAAVLDLGPPVGDGLWLFQELRSRRLPVLVVANHASAAAAGPGLRDEDYFAKPFSPSALLARLGTHLRRARGYEPGRTERPSAARSLVHRWQSRERSGRSGLVPVRHRGDVVGQWLELLVGPPAERLARDAPAFPEAGSVQDVPSV